MIAFTCFKAFALFQNENPLISQGSRQSDSFFLESVIFFQLFSSPDVSRIFWKSYAGKEDAGEYLAETFDEKGPYLFVMLPWPITNGISSTSPPGKNSPDAHSKANETLRLPAFHLFHILKYSRYIFRKAEVPAPCLSASCRVSIWCRRAQLFCVTSQTTNM